MKLKIFFTLCLFLFQNKCFSKANVQNYSRDILPLLLTQKSKFHLHIDRAYSDLSLFEEIYRIKDGKCYFDVSQIMMRAKNRAYDHLKLGYNSLNFYNEWGIDKQVLTSVFIPIRSSLSKTKSLSPFRHLLHCYSNHVRQIEDPIKRIMKFSSLAYTAEQYDKKGEALLFLLEAIRNISNKNSVASQASLLMIYSMSERLNSPIISKEGYQKFVKNFLNLMSKLPYDHKNMDILDNLGSTLFDLGDKSLAVLIYKKHRELASQLTDLEIRNRYLYNSVLRLIVHLEFSEVKETIQLFKGKSWSPQYIVYEKLVRQTKKLIENKLFSKANTALDLAILSLNFIDAGKLNFVKYYLEIADLYLKLNNRNKSRYFLNKVFELAELSFKDSIKNEDLNANKKIQNQIISNSIPILAALGDYQRVLTWWVRVPNEERSSTLYQTIDKIRIESGIFETLRFIDDLSGLYPDTNYVHYKIYALSQDNEVDRAIQLLSKVDKQKVLVNSISQITYIQNPYLSETSKNVLIESTVRIQEKCDQAEKLAQVGLFLYKNKDADRSYKLAMKAYSLLDLESDFSALTYEQCNPNQILGRLVNLMHLLDKKEDASVLFKQYTFNNYRNSDLSDFVEDLEKNENWPALIDLYKDSQQLLKLVKYYSRWASMLHKEKAYRLSVEKLKAAWKVWSKIERKRTLLNGLAFLDACHKYTLIPIEDENWSKLNLFFEVEDRAKLQKEIDKITFLKLSLISKAIEPIEYEIYSTILDDFYSVETVYDGDFTTRTIQLAIVAEQTISGSFINENRPSVLDLKNVRLYLSDLDSSIITDFFTKNISSVSLAHLPPSKIEVKFNDKKLNIGNLSFYKKYPESNGVISFSRVGFSKDKTKALIEIGQYIDGLYAYGAFIVLQKVQGKWKIISNHETWIS